MWRPAKSGRPERRGRAAMPIGERAIPVNVQRSARAAPRPVHPFKQAVSHTSGRTTSKGEDQPTPTRRSRRSWRTATTPFGRRRRGCTPAGTCRAGCWSGSWIPLAATGCCRSGGISTSGPPERVEAAFRATCWTRGGAGQGASIRTAAWRTGSGTCAGLGTWTPSDRRKPRPRHVAPAAPMRRRPRRLNRTGAARRDAWPCAAGGRPAAWGRPAGPAPPPAPPPPRRPWRRAGRRRPAGGQRGCGSA